MAGNQTQEFLKTRRLSEEERILLPGVRLPSYRVQLAIQDGVQDNLMLRTANGLGDVICSEPVIRYALNTFKNQKISLFTRNPELFSHLNLHEIIKAEDDESKHPDWKKYLCLDMIKPVDDIQWEFMTHILMHCVDYPSICAFRCQLPNADKEIHLPGMGMRVLEENDNHRIVIHPGKTWQSRTLPAWWWNAVIKEIVSNGVEPVIMGARNDDGTGTVDVDTTGCLDMRNKLTILGSIQLLKDCKVVLTNDSSPVHMAASGNGWIGVVSTAKHPDLITHWRHGQFGWRMENHSLGGAWQVIDSCPNQGKQVDADKIDERLFLSWLPDPQRFAQWGLAKAIDCE